MGRHIHQDLNIYKLRKMSHATQTHLSRVLILSTSTYEGKLKKNIN